MKKRLQKFLSQFNIILLVLSSLTGLTSIHSVQADSKESKPVARAAVEVTKDNFLDYFGLHGNATYDQSSGIVTLTEDEKSQVGNFTLKNKILMNENFTLEGEANIGDKTRAQGGADGVGFAFHPGDIGSVGVAGGSLGIGGLTDVFGFKLDTFYNPSQNVASYYPDPEEFSDPNTAFGGFVCTDQGEKRAHTYVGEDAPAQFINVPENNAFKPISFNYSGSAKTMTITYDGQTWSKNVSEWIRDDALAFAMSASTGTNKNLQQFKIKSFTYAPLTAIHTKYVDKVSGEEIIEGQTFEGLVDETQSNLRALHSQVIDMDYVYDSVVSENKEAYDEATDTGTFDLAEYTVTYYYTHEPTHIGITKSGTYNTSKKLADIGDTVDYTVSMTSEGRDGALGVTNTVLTDTLPPGMGKPTNIKIDGESIGEGLENANAYGEYYTYDATTSILKVYHSDFEDNDARIVTYSSEVLEGYTGEVKTNTATFTAKDKWNGEEYEVTGKWNFKLKGAVILTKSDDKTHKVLEGAEFELQDSTGKVIQSNLVTDKDGIITVRGLPEGEYQFVETKAPTNYILDPTPVKFTVQSNQATDIKVTKENTLIPGNVTLTKVDDFKNALEGAVFELQDSKGNVLQSDLTTDEKGQLSVKDLAPGDYQFVETKAPNGYTLDTTPHKFTIKPGQTEDVSVEIVNHLKDFELLLNKVDAASGKVVKDATFKISDTLNGSDLGNSLATGISDEAGRIHFTPELQLKAGKTYYLKETAAPKGYKALTGYFEISIEEDGSKVTVNYVGDEEIKDFDYDFILQADDQLNFINFDIPNKRDVVLPDTGSNMVLYSIIMGSILLSAAVIFLYRKKIV